MKNKRIFRSVTALLAALVIMGGFSVTAYAGGGEDWEDYEPIPEETPQPQPLTPEGNMTLVDDIEGEAAEDKQFITVVSKSGNYFYIIIDNAAEGENTVHFLNQVDEADLMAIIGEEETEEPPAVCDCTDKCAMGAINTACPVCSVNMGACTGKEAEPEPEQPDEPQEESGGMGGLIIFLVVAALGGGGAFYYFKILKPKQDAAKGGSDLDNYDFDDEDEEEAEDEEMYLEDEQEDEE